MRQRGFEYGFVVVGLREQERRFRRYVRKRIDAERAAGRMTAALREAERSLDSFAHEAAAGARAAKAARQRSLAARRERRR